MTVKELLAELAHLVEKGHGDLDITTYDVENDEYDFITETELLEGIKGHSVYNINPLAHNSKQKPFVTIS
jgi:hypothetical protein